MEKPKYIKPTVVSLEEVASVLGATCSGVGSNVSSTPVCNPHGGVADGACNSVGDTAGIGPFGGNCASGGIAVDRCNLGGSAAF